MPPKKINTIKRKKEKFNPITVTKEFDNFKDAIIELKESSNIIKEFFKDLDDNSNYDDYARLVAQKASENYPQLLSKRNIHTSYKITPSMVSVKNENNLLFGWKTTYKIDKGQATIIKVENMIIMYKDFPEMKKFFEDNEWKFN